MQDGHTTAGLPAGDDPSSLEAEIPQSQIEPLLPDPDQPGGWEEIWVRILRAGLGDVTMRIGTHVLMLTLILIVAAGLREVYYRMQTDAPNAPVARQAVMAAVSSPTPTASAPVLPPLGAFLSETRGIVRIANLHTTVPSRPRQEVTKYIVQPGDTLFGIAEKFGLKPETILWGNQLVLGDNPHALQPEQELNILPVNGAYHRWSAGDGLNGVAKFFSVKPEDIIEYPGNRLDAATIGDFAAPNIEAGTWLIIPGGTRDFINWSLPPGGIPRENPSVATGFGTGVCGAAVSGISGTGAFIWPANNHFLSGFDWAPDANHSGIDIDGDLGNPIYAADNGVVVYSGWNNHGYGNVVVVNHGNGWQTLYAHMSVISVGCGQEVYQGSVLGSFGSTGNSTGPHLHFEMLYNGTKVNPFGYLP